MAENMNILQLCLFYTTTQHRTHDTITQYLKRKFSTYSENRPERDYNWECQLLSPITYKWATVARLTHILLYYFFLGPWSFR